MLLCLGLCGLPLFVGLMFFAIVFIGDGSVSAPYSQAAGVVFIVSASLVASGLFRIIYKKMGTRRGRMVVIYFGLGFLVLCLAFFLVNFRIVY